jgi:hypothetical protein
MNHLRMLSGSHSLWQGVWWAHHNTQLEFAPAGLFQREWVVRDLACGVREGGMQVEHHLEGTSKAS